MCHLPRCQLSLTASMDRSDPATSSFASSPYQNVAGRSLCMDVRPGPTGGERKRVRACRCRTHSSQPASARDCSGCGGRGGGSGGRGRGGGGRGGGCGGRGRGGGGGGSGGCSCWGRRSAGEGLGRSVVAPASMIQSLSKLTVKPCASWSVKGRSSRDCGFSPAAAYAKAQSASGNAIFMTAGWRCSDLVAAANRTGRAGDSPRPAAWPSAGNCNSQGKPNCRQTDLAQ